MSEPTTAYNVTPLKGLPADFLVGLSGVPQNLRHGLTVYVEHGIRPGHFLTRCLHNDLTAVMLAGPETAPHIAEIVAFLVHYMPGEAWGSEERVNRWVAKGGLYGGKHG